MNAYLHIPFCASICSYCDFSSWAGEDSKIPSYVQALQREIGGSDLPGPLRTVYFGGGTPSTLAPTELEKILAALEGQAGFAPGLEITMEVNPEGAEPAKLEAYRALGVNRISLGAQAAQTELLEALGRRHGWDGVEAAVRAVKAVGFPTFNLDLMLGLPKQTSTQWDESLEKALALQPGHLSLYGLQVEPGTPLAGQVDRGLLVPDEDAQADLYGRAQAVLAREGYLQYEVSNFSKPGQECLHNLAVWRGEDYWGFGVSAVGTVGWERRSNTDRLEAYLAAGGDRAQAHHLEPLTAALRTREKMILGLRLAEGVAESELRASGVLPDQLEVLVARGFFTRRNGRIAPVSGSFFTLHGGLTRLWPGTGTF